MILNDNFKHRNNVSYLASLGPCFCRSTLYEHIFYLWLRESSFRPWDDKDSYITTSSNIWYYYMSLPNSFDVSLNHRFQSRNLLFIPGIMIMLKQLIEQLQRWPRKMGVWNYWNSKSHTFKSSKTPRHSLSLVTVIVITTRIRSLWQGNVFTHVYHSVYRGVYLPTMPWGRKTSQSRRQNPRPLSRPPGGKPPAIGGSPPPQIEGH